MNYKKKTKKKHFHCHHFQIATLIREHRGVVLHFRVTGPTLYLVSFLTISS